MIYCVTIKSKDFNHFDFSSLDGKKYYILAKSPKIAISIVKLHISLILFLSPDCFDFSVERLRDKK